MLPCDLITLLLSRLSRLSRPRRFLDLISPWILDFASGIWGLVLGRTTLAPFLHLRHTAMKLLDSQGRLLGKLSILDLGAGLVILLVLVGIFLVPGTGGSVAQVGAVKQMVEIDAVARGLSIRDPQTVIQEMTSSGKTNVIIRNQPYGSITVKSVQTLTRTTLVPQPDGTVKALPDPRSDLYNSDLYLTLSGEATMTENGPVLGNNKLKIGIPVELEGKAYNFNASVIDVRLLKK